MAFKPRISNQILKHEAYALEEEYKNKKILKKPLKSNKILGTIVIVFIVSLFLSLIF